MHYHGVCFPVRMRAALRHNTLRNALVCALAMSATINAAASETKKDFDIPAQAATLGLNELAKQADITLVFSSERVAQLRTPPIRGNYSVPEALGLMLTGTPLVFQQIGDSTIAILDGAASTAPAAAPVQEAGARDTGSQGEPETARGRAADATTLDTIVVTAQKKVENIQKVPIAISAFGGQDLNDRKIEGGSDLVTAVPNVTFSKTNFASYNFQIRGIGTQALSVTTDPAVAVSFNSTPMIRNRLFEQEYFDVERVEVLRGPQGTLYGRNATAGVVNMIPNLADPEAFEANAKGEFGNYDTRRVNGMINVPLSDSLAFRVATQYTKRDGYDYNTVTKKNVNDRDLLSVRTSVAFKPSDSFSASLAWEHFQEDDNRARTGKQLCHNDPGPETVNGYAPPTEARNYLSQACMDGSLYDRDAFGVPNGGSLPVVLGAGNAPLGFLLDGDGNYLGAGTLIPRGLDPYAGVTQSTDLHEIATTYDPVFKAKNDVVQLNFDIGVTDRLNFISQTLYTRDQYYSTQDYGRFQSNPVFTNTTNSGLILFGEDGSPIPAYDFLPNGVYCDPQLGCSDRLLLVDLVDSDSRQWSQEFRLQSSFDGPFNFSVGANYLEYEVDESYYVFSNVFSGITELLFNGINTGLRPADCAPGSATKIVYGVEVPCVYIDPNSLRGINGQGHNYFRSWNIAKTRSAAIFGEGYWKLSDTLRLTAGLRFTRDVKTTTPVQSQLLLGAADPLNPIFGGNVGYGYPAQPDIRQTWSEPTGRLVLDWSPDLSFTDSTMFYASLSRGYKAGGTNSPGIGANPDYLTFEQRNPEFRAEYVNAFELGMKNVMAGGELILNATAFYNDYKDYQVSQIQDRATLNENFDARTWGAEFEAVWRPTPDFQLSGNIGLLRTRIGANQYSIDVMDRTAGNPDWVIVRPWLQLASNCIAPAELVATAMSNWYAGSQDKPNFLHSFCTVQLPLALGGFTRDQGYGGGPGDYAYLLGPDTYYNPLTDAPNGGAGFAKDVGGNELPNAPHFTVSLSPQYTFTTAHGDLTLRADLYYQGPSWARIYQDKIDRLHDWGNVNLSLTYQKVESDLTVQLYVKNALGGEAITGTFMNSDDSGLTSNVFIQDPRIFGLSIRKGFY
jgi:iron complex outermembrane receptor protein